MAAGCPDPEDEFWHEPENDDPLWRESYYFDVVDPSTGLAYFSSIGYRANKGHMGSVTALVWGDKTYIRKGYAHPTANDTIQVGGVIYEPTEPNETWHVRHLSQVNEFESGSDALRLSASAFPSREHPLHTFEANFRFEGIHHPQYYRPSGEAEDLFRNLFYGHSDQGGRVTGELRLGDQTVQVSGVGERDHSWGIRDWRDPDAWQWTSAIFDQDTAVNYWRVRRNDDAAVEGYLHLDGRSRPITDVTVEMNFRPDRVTPESFNTVVTDQDDRQFEFSGATETVVPVDFEYDDEVTTIRRTPTRYETATKETYGWNEYATTERATDHTPVGNS